VSFQSVNAMTLEPMIRQMCEVRLMQEAYAEASGAALWARFVDFAPGHCTDPDSQDIEIDPELAFAAGFTRTSVSP